MCTAADYEHLLGEAPAPTPAPVAPAGCIPSRPCAQAPDARCAIHRPGIHAALASYLEDLPRVEDAFAYALSLR